MSVTSSAVLRGPFDFGPFETNPYAQQMEREFNRIDHAHLYAAIVAPFEAQIEALRAENEVLTGTVADLNDEIDDLKGAIERVESRNKLLAEALEEIAEALAENDSVEIKDIIDILRERGDL